MVCFETVGRRAVLCLPSFVWSPAFTRLRPPEGVCSPIQPNRSGAGSRLSIIWFSHVRLAKRPEGRAPRAAFQPGVATGAPRSRALNICLECARLLPVFTGEIQVASGREHLARAASGWRSSAIRLRRVRSGIRFSCRCADEFEG